MSDQNSKAFTNAELEAEVLLLKKKKLLKLLI